MAHQRAFPNHALSDIIAKYFEAGYIGHAVDVGASDGVSVNTTYGLEKSRRWTVLSVEPNPEFWPALMQERAFVEKCACSNFGGTATLHVNVNNPEAYSTIGAPEKAEELAKGQGGEGWKDVASRVETLDDLLAKWQFPKLDVLTVDTEGTELDVLKGCDLVRWKPRVIVVECWNTEGPINPYLGMLGYRKISRIQPGTVNDLFYLE